MAQPPKFRPQLATLVARPPHGPEWLHEIKFDGYRIACTVHDGGVRLESRRANDWTARFAEIAVAARSLPVESVLLDGEAAIVAPSGVTSFQALQNAFSGSSRDGLTYFVFDILYLNGRNLAPLPLEERKLECERLLSQQRQPSLIRYSQHFDADGDVLLAQACALGAEGIVSKRRDQPYRPGRNDGWLKTKCSKRQHFAIGGFTDPGGSRAGIGALLVGHFEGGELRFAGKVGTGPGFTPEYLSRVRRELAAIEQPECPFQPPPSGWLGRHAHWVKPVRTGDVVFTEWTDAGTLRHPSFQGFDDDPQRPFLTRGPPATVERRVAGKAPAAHPLPPVPSRTPAPAPTAGTVIVSGVAITSPARSMYPDLNFCKRSSTPTSPSGCCRTSPTAPSRSSAVNAAFEVSMVSGVPAGFCRTRRRGTAGHSPPFVAFTFRSVSGRRDPRQDGEGCQTAQTAVHRSPAKS